MDGDGIYVTTSANEDDKDIVDCLTDGYSYVWLLDSEYASVLNTEVENDDDDEFVGGSLETLHLNTSAEMNQYIHQIAGVLRVGREGIDSMPDVSSPESLSSYSKEENLGKPHAKYRSKSAQWTDHLPREEECLLRS
ncbi:hypothetical protein T265_09825 [Opisthorchis viverrini]|uniref:Uncharacterized protein n=1 Tax=Opisthorchis viverrini TaxID=6198 RepID=A0A075A3J6_OPIVI|nr:hypothetical protein T265_09825 [Opisthorchis viverrini]KER21974.1 hypothetical protein T265_09825 [Opisthorchis viverrini]